MRRRHCSSCEPPPPPPPHARRCLLSVAACFTYCKLLELVDTRVLQLPEADVVRLMAAAGRWRGRDGRHADAGVGKQAEAGEAGEAGGGRGRQGEAGQAGGGRR